MSTQESMGTHVRITSAGCQGLSSAPAPRVSFLPFSVRYRVKAAGQAEVSNGVSKRPTRRGGAPMKALTRFALAASVAGLSLGVAACGSSSSSTSGGGATSLQLTIGQIVPLTGDLSDFGPPGEKAGKLALAQIQDRKSTR